MVSLNTRAWLSLAALAVVMALLLFVPAGTLRYWHAWVYLALFFGLSTVITRDLMRHDPALLARRMKGGPIAERRPQQRIIMVAASIGFIGLLVVPALDFRFGWSVVPLGGVLLGDVLFVVGFGFIGRVYRENTYTSATVEVAPHQRVISTGPYAVVRHPMYATRRFVLRSRRAFEDPLGLDATDEAHSCHETRRLRIAKPRGGRVLVVSYTLRGTVVRIISARLASRKERARYAEA